ncbi:MAG: class I SAM-dependent methyltransferase [Rhodospirillales bacterium]|jgi:methylation protein EvaC|nr:class I SAM-dependent methyltransferase [Rhodospirillales bacterium]
MSNCRTCNNPIEAFMTLGHMPFANGFLSPEQYDQEYFFDLDPAFCSKCGTFQIVEQPNPEKMFHENYVFFTRTSKHMVEHYGRYANWVQETWLDDEDASFVVEIGSNDGALLENFATQGIKHLGVEPSGNVADVARSHGVSTLTSFFGEDSAKEVLREHGPADAIMAANVMCHIPDLHGVAKGVCTLLKKKGVLIFEDPYLGEMVERTSYDQIYSDHVYIFSAGAVRSIFEPHGLELIDVLPQITHGGSMRYVFARKGERSVSSNVGKLLSHEDELGLSNPATFDRFKSNCETSREQLVSLLQRFKQEGKRVIGYGASAKSTTVLNYCQIGPDLIEFISDTTPIKQGKYSPGMHIPVRPYSEFKENYPDVALMFTWNHSVEILENEAEFIQSGGQWIVYVPKVRIF